MGSVNDIGTAGQPLGTPPLTAWQAAVRAALNASDITVDTRIANGLGQKDTGSRLLGGLLNSFTGAVIVRRYGNVCVCLLDGVVRATACPNVGVSVIANAPAGFKPIPSTWDYRAIPYNPSSGALTSGGHWAGLTAASNGWLSIGAAGANIHTYAAFTYLTADIWPTTLPGTPATLADTQPA